MHGFSIRVPKPLEENSRGRALIELTQRSLYIDMSGMAL